MKPKLREAKGSGIPKLVDLLADDEPGAGRQDTTTPLNHRYADAFWNIEKDPNWEM